MPKAQVQHFTAINYAKRTLNLEPLNSHSGLGALPRSVVVLTLAGSLTTSSASSFGPSHIGSEELAAVQMSNRLLKVTFQVGGTPF